MREFKEEWGISIHLHARKKEWHAKNNVSENFHRRKNSSSDFINFFCSKIEKQVS